MPKVTFVVDHTPKGDAPDRPTYKKGETHDLEQSYADKYKRRGWAVDYVEPKLATPEVKPEPVADVVDTASEPAQETRPEPSHHYGRGKRR